MAPLVIVLTVSLYACAEDRPATVVETGEVETSALSKAQTIPRFGGSQSCKGCHTAQYQAWSRSNHASAERLASVELDRAAFDPPRHFTHGTQESSVRLEQGKLVMRTLGDVSGAADFAVVRAIGVEPLVQYLVERRGGAYQVLENAYDPARDEWFDVFGDEDRQPGEWGHWTGRGMNWNSRCASCHNTALKKNYDVREDRFATRYEELGVGCEACHGPLGAHAADPSNASIEMRSSRRMLDVCGSCHARRMELTGAFEPGEAFDDHFLLSVVDASDRYFPDGQVRDENYVFGSFLGSRMHAAGVGCGDCHDPHSDRTILVGNALCERCHATGLQNAPLIDSEAHTHHDEGNAGRECVGCHMPRTIYMQRHPRRDHGFTIPDPVLTTELGVPNACNRCHADRDARWVVEQTEKWYAPKRTLRARDRARLLARARVGERSSIAPLKTMLDEDTQPFWRASAASLLGGFLNDEEARSALHDALVDDSALVRAHAAQALEPLAQGGDPATVRKIRPLLEDAARDVRIAAAMALRGVRGPGVEARADVMTFLEHNADQPQGRLQLSMYDLSRGDHRAALGHIEQALVWDRAAVPLLQQKAVVLSALGRGAEAVSALEDAIALEPDSARLHYLLGLACNEVKEEQRAIDELQRAVELDPMLGRAWYNLGLALHAADETRRALRALEQAQTALPDDPRPSYARATIHYQQGDLEAAAKAAEEALRIFPDFAEARSLVQSLRARRTEDEDSGGPRSRTN